MNRKLSIILVACLVFIIASTGLAVYYASVVGDKDNQISSLEAELTSYRDEVNTLNSTIEDLSEDITQRNNEIFSLNSQIANLNSQIENLSSQIANKPKLVVDGLTVEDDRSSIPYSLHIYGRINNTGEGTAYNAVLHVTALNAEGEAIDTYYNFAGIPAKMSVGVDFELNYTGSSIERWFITPIYTDETILPYNSNSTSSP